MRNVLIILVLTAVVGYTGSGSHKEAIPAPHPTPDADIGGVEDTSGGVPTDVKAEEETTKKIEL